MNIPGCQRCLFARRIKISPGLPGSARSRAEIPGGVLLTASHQHPEGQMGNPAIYRVLLPPANPVGKSQAVLLFPSALIPCKQKKMSLFLAGYSCSTRNKPSVLKGFDWMCSRPGAWKSICLRATEVTSSPKCHHCPRDGRHRVGCSERSRRKSPTPPSFCHHSRCPSFPLCFQGTQRVTLQQLQVPDLMPTGKNPSGANSRKFPELLSRWSD